MKISGVFGKLRAGEATRLGPRRRPVLGEDAETGERGLESIRAARGRGIGHEDRAPKDRSIGNAAEFAALDRARRDVERQIARRLLVENVAQADEDQPRRDGWGCHHGKGTVMFGPEFRAPVHQDVVLPPGTALGGVLDQHHLFIDQGLDDHAGPRTRQIDEADVEQALGQIIHDCIGKAPIEAQRHPGPMGPHPGAASS